MIKIYISGKITGTTDYIKRFERAEKYLSKYVENNFWKVIDFLYFMYYNIKEINRKEKW